MARSRNIKPAFFQNEELGELTPIERLVFIGMWTVANFKGCIELKFKRLKIQLLPYDDCNIEEIVNNLEKARFIRIYSVQGQLFIKIVNFEKHQNPHKNERDAGSDIPDISEKNEISNEKSGLKKDGSEPEFIGTARADSLLRIPDSLKADSQIPSTLIPAVTPLEVSSDPKSIDERELHLACKQTWQSYSDAFFIRYGTEPVRNAKVNGQIKQFVKRLGCSESPQVASLYVSNNTQYYLSRGHSVDCLLADAEKLRTEWATGNQMTATRANQLDKSQANKNAVSEALQLLGVTS